MSSSSMMFLPKNNVFAFESRRLKGQHSSMTIEYEATVLYMALLRGMYVFKEGSMDITCDDTVASQNLPWTVLWRSFILIEGLIQSKPSGCMLYMVIYIYIKVIIVGLAQPLRISLVHPFANFLEKKNSKVLLLKFQNFNRLH